MAHLKFTRQVVRPRGIIEPDDIVDDAEDPKYWRRYTLPKNGKPPAAFYLDQNNDIPHKSVPRPSPSLSSLVRADNCIRLDLPEPGAFNAGMTRYRDGYLAVYRPNEYKLTACFLDKQFQPSRFRSIVDASSDPRLTWTPDGNLLMSFSSFGSEDIEHIVATTIIENDKFVARPVQRVSPPELTIRQKNWLPFVFDGKVYFVASICPHVVYEWTGQEAIKQYETDWQSPWFYKSQLRGNTNIVRLDDGSFLGTFHTATMLSGCAFYDNGCYQFEGRPPFRVLRCSDRTYLRAEDGIEPPFRKSGFIRCTFPVGMVREGERLLISYGDSDSCVRILDTTVGEMLGLTVNVRKKQLLLL